VHVRGDDREQAAVRERDVGLDPAAGIVEVRVAAAEPDVLRLRTLRIATPARPLAADSVWVT